MRELITISIIFAIAAPIAYWLGTRYTYPVTFDIISKMLKLNVVEGWKRHIINQDQGDVK